VAGDIAAEIGRALRTARRRRGLRLKEVPAVSNGRFSPTTVAGYERAERAVTVQRFCDLCEVYGVRPERLLAQALRAQEGRESVQIDLTNLDRLDPEEARLVGGFLRRVAASRGRPGADVVTVRAGDLEVLATAADRSVDELLAEIGTEPPPSRRP
jgi:transcriptional regulator with XRE-family HTH domain